MSVYKISNKISNKISKVLLSKTQWELDVFQRFKSVSIHLYTIRH